MLIAQQPVALFQNITSKQGNPNNKQFKENVNTQIYRANILNTNELKDICINEVVM